MNFIFILFFILILLISIYYRKEEFLVNQNLFYDNLRNYYKDNYNQNTNTQLCVKSSSPSIISETCYSNVLSKCKDTCKDTCKEFTINKCSYPGPL